MEELYHTSSCAETEALAAKFSEKLKKGDIVAFFGDLGAGKTAFVRGAVSRLCPEANVCSPTYAIMNEYIGKEFTVCHMDLYRVRGEDDLYSVGFDDVLDGKRIIFTEWSENIKEFLPSPRYEINITKEGEDGRAIAIRRVE